MEEPASALEEMDWGKKCPLIGLDGGGTANLEVESVPVNGLDVIKNLSGGELDDDRPIRSLLKAKKRKVFRKDREVQMDLGEEGIAGDMDDTLASLKKRMKTPIKKNKSTPVPSKKIIQNTSVEDPEIPGDGLDVSLSLFLSKAREFSTRKAARKGRKHVEEAQDAEDNFRSPEVTDELFKKSDELSEECSGIKNTDELQLSSGVAEGENSEEKKISALLNHRSNCTTVDLVDKTNRSDNLKQCTQGKLQDPSARKIKESNPHVSKKGKIEPLELNSSVMSTILLNGSSADIKMAGKTLSSGDEASPDDNRSGGQTSSAHDQFINGTVCDADDQDNEKPKVLPRASRKIKKCKAEDMTYEGDIEWEAFMNDDRGPFGNSGDDEEQSSRERNLFKSALAVDSSDISLAAVSAGLKAHATGPIEKIKFKDLLKRKGGLRDYLECRSAVLHRISRRG